MNRRGNCLRFIPVRSNSREAAPRCYIKKSTTGKKNYDVPAVNGHAYLRIVKRVVTRNEIYEAVIPRLIGTMEAYYRLRRPKNRLPCRFNEAISFTHECLPRFWQTIELIVCHRIRTGMYKLFQLSRWNIGLLLVENRLFCREREIPQGAI